MSQSTVTFVLVLATDGDGYPYLHLASEDGSVIDAAASVLKSIGSDVSNNCTFPQGQKTSLSPEQLRDQFVEQVEKSFAKATDGDSLFSKTTLDKQSSGVVGTQAQWEAVKEELERRQAEKTGGRKSLHFTGTEAD